MKRVMILLLLLIPLCGCTSKGNNGQIDTPAPMTSNTPDISASTPLFGTITNVESGSLAFSEMSRQSTVLYKVKLGEPVEILSRNGEWYRIIYNSEEAYMQMKYIACSEDVPESVLSSSVVSLERTELETATPPIGESRSADVSADDAEALRSIEVTAKVDYKLSQVIVTITNTGTMTFHGDVTVYIYDYRGKKVGWDIIIIDSLGVGNFTWVRIDVKTPYVDSWTHWISDYHFTPSVAANGGTLNEATSKLLSDAFRRDFGGDGNASDAASWYRYVEKIEVYDSDTGQYAIVQIRNKGRDSAKTIGGAIFANYLFSSTNRIDRVTMVTVVNESGEKLFEKAA